MGFRLLSQRRPRWEAATTTMTHDFILNQKGAGYMLNNNTLQGRGNNREGSRVGGMLSLWRLMSQQSERNYGPTLDPLPPWTQPAVYQVHPQPAAHLVWALRPIVQINSDMTTQPTLYIKRNWLKMGLFNTLTTVCRVDDTASTSPLPADWCSVADS